MQRAAVIKEYHVNQMQRGGRLALLLFCLLFLAGCQAISGYFPSTALSGPPAGGDVPPPAAAAQAEQATASPAPVIVKLPPRQVPAPAQLRDAPALPDPPRSNAPPETPRSLAEGAGRADISCRNLVITEDTTWQGRVLVTGSVTVAPQATLSLDPGTLVRFRSGTDGSRGVLLVHGRLQSNGTPREPVLFTSQYETPVRGDWQGIVLMASDKRNQLEWSRIEGAETGIDALYSRLTLKDTEAFRCGTGIRFQDSLVAVTGGGARECGQGLSSDDSELELREGRFTGNRDGIVLRRGGVRLVQVIADGNSGRGIESLGARLSIAGSWFGGNGTGVELHDTEGTLATSVIVENRGDGIVLVDSRVKVTGCEISRNGGSGLRVSDGLSVAWGNVLADNAAYELRNDGPDDYRAMGNWWGSATAGTRVADQRSDPSLGRVMVAPVLTTRPLVP